MVGTVGSRAWLEEVGHWAMPVRTVSCPWPLPALDAFLSRTLLHHALHPRAKAMASTDHGLRPPRPGAQADLSSSMLFTSGLLFMATDAEEHTWGVATLH